MKYIIAASRSNCFQGSAGSLGRLLGGRFKLITRKNDLTASKLRRWNPRYVFLPHWSYYVPREVFENFECVVFHMTDVPYGRGGSPLQNLILRGHRQTKISALRCSDRVDAGPVYLKRSLSLEGTAEEIYERAARIMEDMMTSIVRQQPKASRQKGKPTFFERRRPSQSSLEPIRTLRGAYDHIRMLDAEGYPRAFLETKHMKYEFQLAEINQEAVTASVKITRKNHA